MKTRRKSYNYQAQRAIPVTPSQTLSIDREKPSTDEELNKQLKELYENVKSIPSLGAKITKFLRKNDLHSKHRQIVKNKFPRRRVIVRYPFELFMADLIEYTNSSYSNNRYKFVLLVIDCFTKMIYIAPMKRKTAEASALAFEQIFNKLDQFPVNIVTDDGLEFFNQKVQNLFLSLGVNHFSFTTKTKMKAMIAERAIRTIKTKIEKYLHLHKTRKWIDIIDQIVSNYNEIPHRTTGFAPVDVTAENAPEIYKKMYPNRKLRTFCRLEIGDKVRKIIEKKDFTKGYKQNWSDEIYEIIDQRQSNLICWYKLKHLNGEKLPGIFYFYQLNLVSKHAD